MLFNVQFLTSRTERDVQIVLFGKPFKPPLVFGRFFDLSDFKNVTFFQKRHLEFSQLQQRIQNGGKVEVVKTWIRHGKNMDRNPSRLDLVVLFLLFHFFFSLDILKSLKPPVRKF